jgi:hypothetical protein
MPYSDKPSDDQIGFKYAALVLWAPDGPGERTLMHGGKETFAGSVLALIPDSESEQWREWIGTVAWNKLKRAERIVIARSPSAAPSVLDDETYRLRRTVSDAWTAFLLSGAEHSGDAPWLISGESEGCDHRAQLRSIRTAAQLERMIVPFHVLHSRRHRDLRAAALEKHWAAHGKHDDSWFARWIEIDDLLGRRTPVPPILWYALRSYGSAWDRKLLEFSIPEFVRAAEGIIALAKGMGAKAFRDRALHLVPSLRTDEYVGTDIDALVADLYQLRSDCVHGKLPFHDMQQRGEEGEEHASQLAYVAEVLAREALLAALRHHDQSVFASRVGVESAWANGSFP